LYPVEDGDQLGVEVGHGAGSWQIGIVRIVDWAEMICHRHHWADQRKIAVKKARLKRAFVDQVAFNSLSAKPWLGYWMHPPGVS
jgi:hypothetical protein